MNFESKFIETNLELSSALTSFGRDKIYIPENSVRLEYQSLYDAYQINSNEVGFLNSEYQNYLKAEGMFQGIYKRVYFNSQFINSTYTGCKGAIAILGRYYSSGHHYVLWEDTPRNDLARLIYSTKENKPQKQFLNWDSHLVKSLEKFLGSYLFRNQELSNDDNSKILITSVPNSDGDNRFETFLKMLSNKINESKTSRFANNIFVDTSFFKLNRPINDFRRGNYNQRTMALEGAFYSNSRYLDEFKDKKWKIIIIDDVFTTGAHLEECLRAIKSSYGNLKYEVQGVFLAATQRPEFVDRTKITYGIPKIIEILGK